MTLQQYIQAIRARWWMLVAGVIVGVGLAIAVSQLVPQNYSSTATLYISAQGEGSNTSSVYQGSLLSQQRTKSYAALVPTGRVLGPVAQEVGLPYSVDELSDRVSAVVVPDTAILSITASDSDAARSATIANGTANTLVAVVTELERPVNNRQAPTVLARVVQLADPPAQASGPGLLSNLLVGAVFGALLGLSGILIRRYLDVSVRTTEDIKAELDVPNIGGIPSGAARSNGLAMVADPRSPEAEAFRRIRTNLQFVAVGAGGKVIAVTSPAPGDGKTTCACNMAAAIAATGSRVILVDADLRKPRVASLLGLEKEVGITTVLSGRSTVAGSTQHWTDANVDVLSSGSIPPNPSELLGSAYMTDLLEQLKNKYDVVVVDTPPVIPVTDALALASKVSILAIVCRYNVSTTPQLRVVKRMLETVALPSVVTILNDAPRKGNDSYGSYYGLPNMGRHASSTLLGEATTTNLRRDGVNGQGVVQGSGSWSTRGS